MTETFQKRCLELMAEITKFQAHVYQKNPVLKQNNTFQFTLSLTKKQNLKCQYGRIHQRLSIDYCKSNTTLLKRLSFLSNNKLLEFAQDAENVNEYHVTVMNLQKKQSSTIKQLQLLL